MFSIVFLASTFATAPIPPSDINLCLDEISSKLEVSGDSAGDVAEATAVACGAGYITDAPGTLGGDMPASERLQVRDRLFDVAKGMVTRRVVRYRACKRTPGCNATSISVRDKSSLREPS